MEIICTMKSIHDALNSFENQLIADFDLCLNEAMVLCCLLERKCSASEISANTRLSNSNASKVIRSVEKKGYIERLLGEEDKRRMYFSLSKQGHIKLRAIREKAPDVPEILKPVFK